MMDSKKTYDPRLQSAIPIYSQYPQLLPLIGQEFGHFGKRLLLIGESHYLPQLDESGKEITIHHNDEAWYEANESLLDTTQKKWLNTRENAGSGENQKYTSKAYSIYRNIEYAIKESGFNPPDTSNMLNYVAYANYFLRPARTGVSLQVTGKDSEVSYAAFRSLVQILEVDYLYFVSKLAWQSFMYMNRDSDRLEQAQVRVFPHPASSWWNRTSADYFIEPEKPLTGKQFFIASLQRDCIFRTS